MYKRQHIRIAARSDGETGRLSVEDDGPGIEPETLPHIFERFYQGDRSRSAGGAGLGLSLVQLIAKLHGGSVKAESAPGVGSRFTIAPVSYTHLIKAIRRACGRAWRRIRGAGRIMPS